MRQDPDGSQLTSRRREPRVVVAIVYTAGSIYLTNRTGIANVPGNELQGCVTRVSSVSQTLRPDEGRVTLGSFSFTAIDLDGTLSGFLDDQLNTQNEGIRNRRVRVWTGDTDDFTDGTWTQVGEYIVSQTVTFEGGEYRFSCADIQRELRQRLFRLARTRLSATLALTDTVAQVDSTTGFSLLEHTGSFTDAPEQIVGYLLFPKTGEIASYTSKSATQFIGLTRQLNNSVGDLIEVTDPNPDPRADYDQRPEVIEFPYLELPGPQLLYALLTGTILDTSIAMPSEWNLGISTSDVDADSFRNIGRDLYDPNNADGGRVFRFIHVEEVDGKRWIEEQLLVPMGCYLGVGNDGKLRLRRITRVISDSSPVVTLNAGRDIISHSGISHHQKEVINQAVIRWNWDGDDYTRNDVFINQNSINEHQVAGLRTFEFQGISATRHGAATIRHIFDTIVDRFGAPPISMRAKVSSAFNFLEVGDIVRVVDPGVRNYVTGGTLNQAFEIRSVSMDWLTGDLELDLWGSSAQTLPEPPTSGAAYALAESWYEGEGTALSSVLSISGNSVTTDGELEGAETMSDPDSIFYHDGDLIIPNSINVDILQNVQLRILGEFVLNGTINGVGGGPAGIPNPDTVSAAPVAYQTGQTSYGLGTTQSSDGLRITNPNFAQARYAPILQGLYPSMPHQAVTVENGALVGYLEDLRGVPGPNGPSVTNETQTNVATKGGDGGAGGAGLMIVARDGVSRGVNGSINLSGGDGGAPDPAYTWPGGANDFYGGAGGGGAPGGLAIFLDSTEALRPETSLLFTANQGNTPQTGTPGTQEFVGGKLTFGSYPGTGPRPGLSDEDHADANVYVMWLPLEAEIGEGAQEALPVPSIVSTVGTQFGVAITVQSIPESRYDVIEVWGSVTSNLADATLLFSGTGQKLLVPLDRLTTYYLWLRARQGARVSAWDTEDGTQVAGGGQAIAPISLSDVFMETFDAYETQADFERYWEILIQGVPGGVEFNRNGQNGGKAMRVTGSLMAVWRENIPYDPTGWLYRQEARFRLITAQAGNQALDIGLLGVKADGTTVIDMLGNTNKQNFQRTVVQNYQQDQAPAGEWERTVSWLAGSAESEDALGILHIGTQALLNEKPYQPRTMRYAADNAIPRYIRPVIRCNWLGSLTACELDHFTIQRRDRLEYGSPAVRDPFFSLADDKLYWHPGGSDVVFDVGAGIDGKNAMRFDIEGVVATSFETRFPIELIGDTVSVRIQYKGTGGYVSNPTLTCWLSGYKRNTWQSAFYSTSAGSISQQVIFSGLDIDGDWHPYTFTLSNVLSSLGDADIFVVRFIVQSGNASNSGDFWIGRVRLAQA